MKTKTAEGRSEVRTRLMEVVGAGRLTSEIWKVRDEDSGCQYRFNIVPEFTDARCVFPAFRPADLIPLVKLVQVLAAEMTADGCLSRAEHTSLRRLTADLDAVLQASWPPDHDPSRREDSSDGAVQDSKL